VKPVFNWQTIAAVTNNYFYETKCRRCGDITKQTYSEMSPAGFSAFSNDMNERSLKPRPYRCGECRELTSQDVVFYGVVSQVVDPRPYLVMVD
jgi:hypothetical protein